MDPGDLYPPSPPGAHAGTRATAGYRLRVALVLLALALFLGVYLGLVAVTFGALYWLATGPHKLGFAGVMLGAGDLMLFLFLLKGLFRRGGSPTRAYLEIVEADQPRLFAFVRRLCADAQSPVPAAVYLTHEVNAAVFYPRSLLSLILPGKKNLLIGLGLVNALNLSELKAVLAHELGHFAQSSLRLGQYVYVANQVISDLVFSRDTWDEWLAGWRRIDVRLSFPAWILTGVVWLIRKALGQLFRLVNVANLSLSRQMEFDADLHAVGLTGSDALISGLWKTERGGIAMDGAWATLGAMVGYGKLTADAFYHQRAQLRRLDRLLDEAAEPSPFVRALREPYRHGAALHFHAGDDHAPSMWSTHPSNREREVNAKRAYLDVAPVETSAWELFDHKKALRKRITLLGYQQRLGKRVLPADCLPAREVEALARAEREEQEQAPHYHGFYERRFLDPGDVDALAREVDALSPEDLAALREPATAWAGEPLAEFMRAYTEGVDDEARLLHVDEKKKTFELHGKTLSIGKAPRLLARTRQRLEPLRARLASADAAIFRHFYARTAGDPDAREELLTRYRFLRSVEDHVRTLNGTDTVLGGVVQILNAGPQLSPEQFRSVRDGLVHVHARLDNVLERTRELRIPRLSHLDENTRVRAFVLGEELCPPPTEGRLQGAWIAELGRQHQTVLVRLRRLHFKNLGALLRLQEKLDPELYGVVADREEAGGEGEGEG